MQGHEDCRVGYKFPTFRSGILLSFFALSSRSSPSPLPHPIPTCHKLPPRHPLATPPSLNTVSALRSPLMPLSRLTPSSSAFTLRTTLHRHLLPHTMIPTPHTSSLSGSRTIPWPRHPNHRRLLMPMLLTTWTGPQNQLPPLFQPRSVLHGPCGKPYGDTTAT